MSYLEDQIGYSPMKHARVPSDAEVERARVVPSVDGSDLPKQAQEDVETLKSVDAVLKVPSHEFEPSQEIINDEAMLAHELTRLSGKTALSAAQATNMTAGVPQPRLIHFTS